MEADVRRVPAATGGRAGEEFVPFDPVADYDEYVDGKLRAVRVRSFLAARGIALPDGAPDDPPDAETIAGIGNRKNKIVLKMINDQGVEPYAGSVRYVKAVGAAGLPRAVVSSSTNCRDVLAAAGIEDLFEAIIDGHVAEREHLKGKPAPDTFLAGAGARRRSGAGGRLRGCALWRRGRTGGPLRLCRRRRSGRSGRRIEVPRRGRGGARPRQALGRAVILHPAFGRAVVAAGVHTATGPTRGDRVGVRAVERTHRATRQPRRGRAERLPGSYRPASTRSARSPTGRRGTALRRPARRSST